METALIISSVLLWIAVLFNLFLTFALVRRSNASTQLPQTGGLKPGTEAPDFQAQTLDGQTKKLADYGGDKTAFVFFSSHCQPCRTLLTSLSDMKADLQQTDINLVLVSSDEEREQTVSLVEEMDIHFPILLAPRSKNTFFTDYEVSGTPSYCFVNSDGKVRASGFPMLQSGKWKELTESWEGDEVYAVSGERR